MLRGLQITSSGGSCDAKDIFPNISEWAVTGGFCVDVTSEPNPEWKKSVTYTGIWKKNIPGRKQQARRP